MILALAWNTLYQAIRIQTNLHSLLQSMQIHSVYFIQPLLVKLAGLPQVIAANLHT
jgi:hypothetical protein